MKLFISKLINEILLIFSFFLVFLSFLVPLGGGGLGHFEIDDLKLKIHSLGVHGRKLGVSKKNSRLQIAPKPTRK
jgi:hypothetical protein